MNRKLIRTSLGDAEEELLEAALMRKDVETGMLSVHRLIQSATLRRMTLDKRVARTDVMVKLLTWAFPDTWSVDVGHQISSWARAEKCIAHAVHLTVLRKSSAINIGDRKNYGELLLRCSWYVRDAGALSSLIVFRYLYEREIYDLSLIHI